MKENLYLDLTEKITPDSVVFPGDPAFRKREIHSISQGSSFNLSEISMCNHIGTHIDFPAHVVLNGKTSSDYSIGELIGDGIIIEAPDHMSSIDVSFLKSQQIQEKDFVFFKTRNSRIKVESGFSEEYVFIEPDAATLLVALKVRGVGVDYLSVDSIHEADIPTHNIFLLNDVLIIENVALSDIEPGRYCFFIIPINIPDMDGLPTRVFCVKREC